QRRSDRGHAGARKHCHPRAPEGRNVRGMSGAGAEWVGLCLDPHQRWARHGSERLPRRAPPAGCRQASRCQGFLVLPFRALQTINGPRDAWRAWEVVDPRAAQALPSPSCATLELRVLDRSGKTSPQARMPRPTPTGFGPIKARPPYAAPGQAIGLLGGSFNPPHVAHRMISEAALKRLGLDKVWWVVSPGNPLKRQVGTMPLGDRMALCREVAKNPHIVVTDF